MQLKADYFNHPLNNLFFSLLTSLSSTLSPPSAPILLVNMGISFIFGIQNTVAIPIYQGFGPPDQEVLRND